MKSVQDIAIDRQAVAAICRRYGVCWLALFGSIARGERREDSDVDLLYELQQGSSVGYVTLGKLADELADLFGVEWADMTTPSLLAPHARESAMRDMVVIYAE